MCEVSKIKVILLVGVNNLSQKIVNHHSFDAIL